MCRYYSCRQGEYQVARIIETEDGKRRMIKLSTNDIISVVQEYQRIVLRNSDFQATRSLLDDRVIYIPEDL